ncbi:C40 family peptidase [Cohnella cholangitidis]|uniref:NlpC/P60 family protein n=1 Tax=Cohnella cholangitidis TaxID=2598458 RepID=A0A7G5C2B8_9BACL|nr:C40 family peptidase [Cohnella cholangitidis]QMV43352.1 NlpC/P60 family protein [Cohnella cholangitidis]
MTNKNRFKKLIISAACFMVMATGLGAGHHSTYAATQSSTTAAISSTSAQKKNAIIAFAKSLQGKVRYKYGTNNASRLWFDCSSFTKYVFAKQGINLKWGTSAQSKQGVYVSKSNLKKGDLIFFSVGTPGKINHVGIYIGNGQFIHNTIGSSVNGVIISKLSSYSKRYITARRVN